VIVGRKKNMKKERKVILAIAALSIAVMMVTATVPVLGTSKLSNQDTFDFITGAKKADFNDLNVAEISGGFGVTAVINNTGTVEATNISWSIYFCSGLVFIGGLREGTINVPAGGRTMIRSGLVFGFGPGSITVTAGGASKIVSCFVLGPFVLRIGPYP
jgi:hypothetical protein